MAEDKALERCSLRQPSRGAVDELYCRSVQITKYRPVLVFGTGESLPMTIHVSKQFFNRTTLFASHSSPCVCALDFHPTLAQVRLLVLIDSEHFEMPQTNSQ